MKMATRKVVVVSDETHKQLKEYSKQTGIKLEVLVDLILKKSLAKKGSK